MILMLLLVACRLDPSPDEGKRTPAAIVTEVGERLVEPLVSPTISTPFPAVLLASEIPLFATRRSTENGSTHGDPATAATLVGPIEVSVLEEVAGDGYPDAWMRVRAADGTEGWVHEHHTAIVRTFTLAQLRDLTRGGAPFPLLTGWWVEETGGVPYLVVNGFLEVTEAGFVRRPKALWGKPSPETMNADQQRWMSTWYKPGTTYLLHQPARTPTRITVGAPHVPGCSGFAVEASADLPDGGGVPDGDFLVTTADQVRRVPPFRVLTSAEVELVQQAARAALSTEDAAALPESGLRFHGGIAFDADAEGTSDLVAAVSSRPRQLTRRWWRSSCWCLPPPRMPRRPCCS